mgnify:CR=1 FL=1
MIKTVSALVFTAVLMLGFEGGTAMAQQNKSNTAWDIRCTKDDDGQETDQCEMFSKISVKDTGQRVVEFAIRKAEKDPGRVAEGIIILPLGILLPPGVKMQIDSGEDYSFNLRSCTQAGCFAVVSLNQQLINQMKGGIEAKIRFANTQGKPIRLNLSLKGFTKAWNELKKR